MRIFALLLLPSIAFAFDSDPETLVFEASQELFRGEDASTYFPSADSVIAIKFSADTRTEIIIDQAATSTLSWPDAMAHTLEGAISGGLAEFLTETTLGADIHVNAFGQVFDVPIWTESFTWTAEQYFDSLLLPGSPTPSISLSLPDAHYFQFDTSFQLAEGILITVGIDGNPVSTATVTGTNIQMNGVEMTGPGAVQLGMSDINRGTYDVDAIWTGHVNAAWGVQLIPWIEVDVTDLGALQLPLYTFDWDLGTDSRDISSKVTTVEHSIPAIDTYTVLDLGDVIVGDVTERDFDIDNIGGMTLTGTAAMQGDAMFDVLDRSFSTVVDGVSHITISFAPTTEGDFSGTLILRTNDPLDPTVEIPVIGTAVPVIPLEEEPIGSGEEFGRIRGCGCSATSGMTGAPYAAFVVGLFGLFGLRRRE